jgi:uncharacterized protein YgbK (DUF1537 family)
MRGRKGPSQRQLRPAPRPVRVSLSRMTTQPVPRPASESGNDDLLPPASTTQTRTVLALDDDPTGTQTVRGVPVLTRWTAERLRRLLDDEVPLAYLLTNSRSLPSPAAAALARQIGALLREAADGSARGWSVVSRSDSTLRGHFPVEVDALAEGLGTPEARVLLSPFFADGGRVTIDAVHYLRRDGQLTPVGETEFARDPTFGYRSSDLRDWVAERTGRDDRATAHVGLAALRENGPGAVRDALLTLPPRGVLICDSVEERDIEIVAAGAQLAEESGLPLIARTAASYVRSRGGQAPAAPLGDDEIDHGSPGLIVVGSHVPTTSAQLERLLGDPPVELEPLELEVGMLLEEPGRSRVMADGLARRADTALREGRTPVIFTTRALARGTEGRSDLDVAAIVSAALVEAVRSVTVRPAWVLAKGGITSSDVATHGLGVDEALVLGPLLPGVPTWRCGPASRWPGILYVVFPGNVGGPDALRDAAARLAGRG